MATALQLGEAGAELGGWLQGKRYGPVGVLEVTSIVEPDSDGVPAIFLRVLLTDPPEGSETWPLEHVLELRHAVLTRARERGIEVPVYVELSPETETAQEDDEPEP